MGCISNGPCLPYELELCCLVSGGFSDPCTLGGEPVPQSLIDNVTRIASEVLYTSTGRQFSQCQVKVRPCSNKTKGECPELFDITNDFGFGYDYPYPWIPFLNHGVWTNISTCPADCCSVCEIPLPYPICSIDEVKVNGFVLGPSLYRVDDFKTLVRLPGENVVFTGEDWTNASAYNPGVNIDTGNLQIAGGGVTRVLPFPLLDRDVLSVNGVTGWTLGGQDNPEPYNPALYVQFLNNGDTATVNAALVAGVSGPATYNDVTGVITYTGENSPPRTTPTLVRIEWLQSVKATTITFDQPTYIYDFTYSDLAEGADACWPTCQSLELDDDQDDTFSVTLTYGRSAPDSVKWAAGLLACELLKACKSQPCLLPQRLQTVSRQGVTVGFLDPMQFLGQGLTGIYGVDLVIRQYNPKGLLKTASVYSPDQGRRWRRDNT